MDAIHQMGHILLSIAEATADGSGFGCAKLVVFANIPEDNPFMAGAYMGAGEPEAAVNIGVSGPGVVCSALKRRMAHGRQADAWATWPRRSRSPASASRGWAN